MLTLAGSTVSCAARLERQSFDAAVAELLDHGSLRQTVDSLAVPLIASGRNIGMAIAVATPEGDAVFTYGSTEPHGQVPLARDAVFQVGSVTKSFTALLAAQLAREGRVDLNAPIAPLLPPSLSAAAPDLQATTLYQLASHTSGLGHEVYDREMMEGTLTYLFNGSSLYRFVDSGVMIDYVSRLNFNSPRPGTYAYSNLGMVFLGFVLGQVEHRGYAALLSDEVLTPLGLHHTGLSLPGQPGLAFTPGFAGDLPPFLARDTPVDPWLFDEGISGAGGLYSTIDDLLLYAKACAGMTPTPLAAAIAETQKPRAKVDDGLVAMSWFVKELPDSHQPYVYIAGIIGGHTSFVGFDRRRQLAVVVLQNSINHDDLIGVELLDRLVAAADLKAREPRRPATPPEPRPRAPGVAELGSPEPPGYSK